MKAIRFTRFGAPDVLELIDVPTPKPTDGNAGADSRKRDAVACARLLANLTDGFERGRYTAPIVNAHYPLARAKEAYAAMERGSQGRIVLRP
jgi:NADPH:quinone reductase-like Zn-dependent oxidoreductase